MFTLAKLSYAACDKEAKRYYNSLETLEIQVKSCCIDRLQYMRNETNPKSSRRKRRATRRSKRRTSMSIANARLRAVR